MLKVICLLPSMSWTFYVDAPISVVHTLLCDKMRYKSVNNYREWWQCVTELDGSVSKNKEPLILMVVNFRDARLGWGNAAWGVLMDGKVKTARIRGNPSGHKSRSFIPYTK